MFSTSSIQAVDAAATRSAGRFLASSLYTDSRLILLSGELGVGKTTFTQGLAEGLGVTDRVQSPTYALEQRYEKFTHIDLYRLSPSEASAFLMHSEDAIGIRVIEWADRVGTEIPGPRIAVHIDEADGGRQIQCRFEDEPVPLYSEIDAWISEVRLPAHIRAHTEAVARVADILTLHLQKHRSMLVRTEAVHAAARVHDLLRFVDFPHWNGDEYYLPDDDDRRVWNSFKERFGTPHEDAAARFLIERGYPVLADIVRTHRGADKNGAATAVTTEQLLLCYADKRVRFDTVVSLDERFDDFLVRYGRHRDSDYAKKLRSTMKDLEKKLFPEGPPELH